MAETDLSDWLTISEAAALIGCSTRTIERWGRARLLEQRLRPQAGSPPVAVYSPDDVARIAAERRAAPAPFVLPAVSTGNGNGHRHGPLAKAGRSPFSNFDEARAAMVSVVTDLARAMQTNLSPPSPPVSATVAETPWIDIPTAAAVLGRSEAYVRRQIKDGRLKAERDRCLVVRRTDVEEL